MAMGGTKVDAQLQDNPARNILGGGKPLLAVPALAAAPSHNGMVACMQLQATHAGACMHARAEKGSGSHRQVPWGCVCVLEGLPVRLVGCL